MNIFYLDRDVQLAAQYHCDKHVVKMILESAQLLSTAHRYLDGEMQIRQRLVPGTLENPKYRKHKSWVLQDAREHVLYSATHINHPSAIWCRENIQNYNWLYQLFHELCHEYTYRYGKVHACAKLIDVLRSPPVNIKFGDFFAPTPAMPPELKIVADNPQPGRKYDVLKSYHNYYNVSKRSFASWQGKVNSRPTPAWYTV